jgi:hypothetical protein
MEDDRGRRAPALPRLTPCAAGAPSGGGPPGDRRMMVQRLPLWNHFGTAEGG